MAGRIRSIRPEITDSQTLARCKREARLLFLLLFTIADDDGRLPGDPVFIARKLFPYDRDANLFDLVDGWLAELETVLSIVRYEADGNHWIAIPQWRRHQKIDKPTASRIPAPSGLNSDGSRSIFAGDSPDIRGGLDDDSTGERKGREGIGEERKGGGRATSLPKPFAVPDEWREWARTERPDLDIDAVAALFVDHWHGTGKAMKDWLATWRVWVRREAAPKVNGHRVDDWRSTDAGIARKAKEEGVSDHGCKNFAELRARVDLKLRKQRGGANA